jgi:uncharacterized GH25 family protein
LILVGLLLLAACTTDTGSGLGGKLIFANQPIAAASVEIYLKSDKDRSTLPFMTTTTDAQGVYQVQLPAGRYFIIAKLRQTLDDGRTRMLMAECPANPIEVRDHQQRTIPTFSLREMGRDGALVALPETGVRGRLLAVGQPVANATVYVYTESASGLMGPSYGESVQSDESGFFQIDLPAGRFFFVARKRSGGSRMGEPDAGDLNGIYPNNPVDISAGRYTDLPDLMLTPVDATVRAERLADGKFAATPTWFSGRVVNQDGRPVPDIFVFAYLDSRMVGKPTYISAATDDLGTYRLNLGTGGTYYLGARSTFGGPLEPGEWVGTFDTRADHGVEIEAKSNLTLADIVVREVW